MGRQAEKDAALSGFGFVKAVKEERKTKKGKAKVAAGKSD